MFLIGDEKPNQQFWLLASRSTRLCCLSRQPGIDPVRLHAVLNIFFYVFLIEEGFISICSLLAPFNSKNPDDQQSES